MDVYQAPFYNNLRQITQDPFAWPFEDVKPENLHSHSTLEIPFLSETTEPPIEQSMINERSKNILDDLFIKLRQESMIQNTSHTTEIIDTSTTVLPAEESLLITTETSFFSSTVENVTKLIEDVSAATNSSVNKKSKIHEQITNHFAGNTSSEFFSPAFVESATSTMTEKSLFSTSIDYIRKLMENTTSTATEPPVYQSSTTNTTTTLNDVSTFGLDTPVNISSVAFPFKKEQTSSGLNSMKDLLSFTHTTEVDPSITQRIHKPATFPIKSESDYFNQIKTTTGESPINTNGAMSEMKEILNSIFTTKAEPSIIISSTSSSTSTESNFFNQRSVLSESPIVISSSTMESPINITVDTTKLQDIFSSTTTLDQSDITTLTTEITSAASEITSAASETTIAVSEFTTPSTEFTSSTTEILNIAKNVTFQTGNGTGTASPEYEDNNTWLFYVILVTTILILFIVIGGVFFFYKKVRGGKGSGYQVSQMKEYNSSSGTVNDTNNVKV